MNDLGPYWGITLADWAQLIVIATSLGAFAFTATPKGIKSIIGLTNWFRTHVLNDKYIYRLERVERAVAYLEEEFGFDLEDYKRANPPER